MTFSNGDQAKWITGECTLGEPIYKVVEIKGTFDAGGETFYWVKDRNTGRLHGISGDRIESFRQ